MDKFFSTAAIFLFSFIIGLSYTKGNSPLFKTVPWKIFFPGINGNIGDYQLVLPDNYKIFELSEFGADGFLWGDSVDLEVINSSDEELKIDEAQRPVFRVRFTKNAFVTNGKISDNTGPITEASFKKQGIKDLNFKSGYYNAIQAIPAISISGKLENTSVYMVYFYSPVDNMVVLVNLQGGKEEAETTVVWKSFVESLQLK